MFRKEKLGGGDRGRAGRDRETGEQDTWTEDLRGSIGVQATGQPRSTLSSARQRSPYASGPRSEILPSGV